MSATVSYKGSTITTVNNQTRKLNTSGKYLEDDITIVDTTGSSPTYQTKTVTYTPTLSEQTDSVTPDVGYGALDEVIVVVNPIPSYYGLITWDGSALTIS